MYSNAFLCIYELGKVQKYIRRLLSFRYNIFCRGVCVVQVFVSGFSAKLGSETTTLQWFLTSTVVPRIRNVGVGNENKVPFGL